MGKTALATNIAFHAAKKIQETGEKGSIAFFSLEMSSEQLSTRILAEQSRIKSNDIRRGKISEEQFEQFIETSKNISESVTWVGKWTFVLAAAGSAVGLGNIWGFSYKVGEAGGSAFVLIYLGCILVVGLPIMMAEIMIGRYSQHSPVSAMKKAAIDSGKTGYWQSVGWTGLFSGVLILSFYSVLAGICINYIGIAAMPNTDISSFEQYAQVTGSPSTLFFWHSIFIGMNIAIIASGVIAGIERMVRLLMPMLFILMIVMLINAMINGDFNAGLAYLFTPDFSKVNPETFLSAMGQAFFSLSLGMGSIMCYGSYMRKSEDIFKTSLTVAGWIP